MKTIYKPEGICPETIEIEVEDGVVSFLSFKGGCSGNLQALSRLVVGMPVEIAMERLSGIHCGKKDTSCPDQLSKALATFN